MGEGTPSSGEVALAARGGLVNLAGGAGSAAFGFAFLALADRLLPVGGAGALFEAVALFTICANAAELGVDDGLLRQVPLLVARRSTQALGKVLVLALVPAAAAAALAGALILLYAPELAHVFIHGTSSVRGVADIRELAPFLPMATVASVALAGTRALGAMVPYAAIQGLGVPLLRPLLLGLASVAGLGTGLAAVTWGAPLLPGLAGALVALFILARRTRLAAGEPGGGARRQASPPDRSLGLQLWRFSAPRGLAAVLQIGVLQLDILLVGGLRTASQAGIYTVASRYLLLGTVVLQAIGASVAPQISRLLAAGDARAAQTVFQTATGWVVVATWPVYVTMAVFAPVLMAAFGRQFTAGALALTILAGGMLVSMALGNNQVVLLMAGSSGWNLVISAASLGANVGLNLWLVPRLGMVGAAIAWAAVIVLSNLATTAVIMAVARLSPFGRSLPVAAASAAGCFGLVGLAWRGLLGRSPLGLALTVVLGGGAYLVIIRHFRHSLRLGALAASLRARLRAPSLAPAPDSQLHP